MARKLYVSADNNIKYLGAMDDVTESYINTATVTFEVKNSAGTVITGGTGTCSYVTSSNGNYVGVLDAAAEIVDGTTYYLEVTATASGGYNDFRRQQCVGAYRQET